jgi:hypothetical protein
MTDLDLGPEIAATETGLHWSLETPVVNLSTGEVREPALGGLEVHRGGTIDVLLRKRSPDGVSRNDRDQEVLIASQALLRIEALHHHNRVVPRRCSENGVWVLSASGRRWLGRSRVEIEK